MFQEYDKLVLTPLPRYLYASCCGDQEHAPNINNEGHVETQIADLEEHQRLWRGIGFREKVRNLKVVTAAKLLADKKWWSGDPVHPTSEGYERVAKFIIQGLKSMEQKRDSILKEEEAVKERKRPRADSQTEATGNTSAAKRGPWQSTGDYVTRQEPSWGPSRGRGGHGGRAGWMRGRGGRFSYF
jgi:hypothetical protein